jgi:hypothetical protein
MTRTTVASALFVLALTACADPAASSLSPIDGADAAAREFDPTATWKIPLADAGLSLQSDGMFGDGTYSVYANGVCRVSATIFANSGDATVQTTAPKGNTCGRRFRVVYPDGGSDFTPAFNNLNKLQQPPIPVGTTEERRLILNPGEGTRCGRVIFGSNGIVGDGTDKLLVTRMDARTWQVQSQASPNDRAFCESNGAIYNMQVSFVIIASRDLP